MKDLGARRRSRCGVWRTCPRHRGRRPCRQAGWLRREGGTIRRPSSGTKVIRRRRCCDWIPRAAACQAAVADTSDNETVSYGVALLGPSGHTGRWRLAAGGFCRRGRAHATRGRSAFASATTARRSATGTSQQLGPRWSWCCHDVAHCTRDAHTSRTDHRRGRAHRPPARAARRGRPRSRKPRPRLQQRGRSTGTSPGRGRPARPARTRNPVAQQPQPAWRTSSEPKRDGDRRAGGRCLHLGGSRSTQT